MKVITIQAMCSDLTRSGSSRVCPVQFEYCRGWRPYGLSGLLLQNVTALMEKTFPKICLEFSMVQLGNPFEQRCGGLPVFKILFRCFFLSGNSASSSVDVTEIKGVLG